MIQKSTKKRVMVTGGAGFLGSHLCERLLGMGCTVYCVDNFYTGRYENIAHLTSCPSFILVRQDVCDALWIGVDEIYNLACPASPVHYQLDPIRTTRTSVYGAINVLELARKIDARVLQASTSEVYGNPLEHPQGESYWGNVNPNGRRSCYDEGKRCAESLFFDYRRQHNVSVKVARIFNTYGPRMDRDDGRVISNFVMQALMGEDITVYGDGRQTRSFCYVDDLIEALVRLMASDDGVTGPINVGNPTEVAIGDVAEMVVGMVESESRIVMKPLPEDDPLRRRPNITLARRLLGWSPRVPLDVGLRQTIRYFEKALSRKSCV